jgi:uncharacterized Ntn-hydrolase superfamily protein
MMRIIALFLLTIGVASGGVLTSGEPPPQLPQPVHTFSIVAHDPAKKEWGVAVASRVLAVGSVVPWAKAGSGAIATQSYANVTFGPRGLEMLTSNDGQKAKTAQETLDALISSDSGKDDRQVAVVDAEGNTASFTGKKCIAWAGSKSGTNFSCQGNLLAGPEVVDAMAEAFEKSKGPLAWRLAASLEAGEKAGGDKRGKQSAAILVVRDKAGYGGFNDRLVDLRVDDHEAPVAELLRILSKAVPRPKIEP